MHATPIEGVHVLIRGWLHGNVIAIAGDPPVLIDTGYCTGADETARFCEQATGRPLAALRDIYLTHVHSDHAGGCAELMRRSGAKVHGHARCRELVERWDGERLWLTNTGQQLPRFRIDELVAAGDEVVAGALRWRVVELPGHATGGVGLYCEQHRALIAGDALWERGFGVLWPEVDGEAVIDQAATALDRIEALAPALVVPGHGAPFADVAGALARARDVIERWRTAPDELRRTAALGLVAFWLLANPGASRARYRQAVSELGAAQTVLGETPEQRIATLAAELERRALVRFDGDRVFAGAGVRG